MTVTTAEAAVRELLEEHAAAMREKDADRVAACHRPGAVVYDLAPPLAATFDRERTRAWFAEKGGGSDGLRDPRRRDRGRPATSRSRTG